MTNPNGTRWPRIVGTLVALVAIAAGAVAVGRAVTARPQAAHQTTDPAPTKTAAVTRGTVTERLQVAGTLGFDGSYPVIHQGAPGILTSAAGQGSAVEQGGILYAVDNQPVRLLLGGTPAFRDLATGMTDGPDVRELEENLVALGMDPDHHITVDDHFTSATADAIRRWQAAWGLPANQHTGTLPKGQVVFLTAVLRVGQLRAAVGTAVTPNTTVLTATSSNRVVTAQVAADRQTLIHTGDQVLILLAGRPSLPGTVTAIGQVAAQDGGSGGGAGGGSGGQTAQPAPNGPATVQVTISVALPPGGPDLDHAPVHVAITTASHPDVLLVPVVALLARPGGGYQVRLASGAYVQVQPGLFDETAGTVEISGADLTVDQRVEVPAS